MYNIGTIAKNNPAAFVELDKAPTEVICHNHIERSHEMILNAMSIAKEGKALVLGCGNCADLPLKELSQKFRFVDLIDMNKTNMSSVQANQIIFYQADITGMIRRVRNKLLKSTSFLQKDTDFLDHATNCLASIKPSFWNGGHKYSIVICPGLLTQLQANIRKEIERIFLIRFPKCASLLLEYPTWIKGIWQFARQIESSFIEHIQTLLTPSGIFYLSDTVHVSWLFPLETESCVMYGKWIATKTSRLADYLPGNYHIEKEARWNWARFEQEGPYIGRLYDVQAVISTLQQKS